jgi:hypothetical protein
MNLHGAHSASMSASLQKFGNSNPCTPKVLCHITINMSASILLLVISTFMPFKIGITLLFFKGVVGTPCQYTDSSICNSNHASEGCWWNESDQACQHASICSDYTISSPCEGYDCYWINGVCVDGSSVQCSDLNIMQCGRRVSEGCVVMNNSCQNAVTTTTPVPVCAGHTDQDECGRAGCVYDTSRGVCTERCNSRVDQADCSNGLNCSWNVDLALCSDPVVCSSIMVAMACRANSQCSWDGSACSDNTGGSSDTADVICPRITSWVACDILQGLCSWSSETNSCSSSGADISLTCYGQTNSDACEAMTDCTWNSDQEVCLPPLPYCASQMNQSKCNEVAFCSWDSEMCLPKSFMKVMTFGALLIATVASLV